MPRPALPRRLSGAASALIVVVLAACSSGSGVRTEDAERRDAPATADSVASDPRSGTDPQDPVDGIGWERFDDRLDTAQLEVPIDYDDPSAGSFELFLVRHRAGDEDRKIGSLLINPGGPGSGGADYAAAAELVFGDEILDRFDIIGWDPRGTGYTKPAIDCIDDYDEQFAGIDITPDDAAEREAIIEQARELTERCMERNGDIFQHVGTNDSARDIDAIRRALGEDTISYFGFSYGSELGATWATLFPDTVRAAVLDGAVDPTADAGEGELQQAVGFEQAITTYLAQCSADRDCAFHNDGDAEGAYDALMAELDEHPIPTEPGRPDLTLSMANQGVIQAMYDDSTWNQLSEALAAAQDGDGAGLLALYDAYYRRSPNGTWGNLLEAFLVISCADQAERPTIEESDARALEIHEAAPRRSPGTTGEYGCTFFPPSESPRIDITGAGAGPIVVIGTTGDAATPLAGTRVMADTLEDGRLIVVTADKHTGYGENACVDDLVHRYLVDLEPPPDETEC
jgi:pimeloyl-ACP methyl ester carboxylesterase